MTSSEHQAKQMKKYIQEQKLLAEKQRQYRNIVNQDENERIDYTRKIEKTYKPFIETMKPLEKDIAQVKEKSDETQNLLRKEVNLIKEGVNQTNQGLLTNLRMIEGTKQVLDENREITTGQLRRLSFNTQGLQDIDDKESKTDKISIVGNLPKKYIPDRDNDSMSIKYDQDEGKFYIGNYSYFNINGNDIEFERGKTIKGTEGLWILLTRKDPINGKIWRNDALITSQDIAAYTNIIY